MHLLAKALSVLVIGAATLIAKADTLNIALFGEGNVYTFSLPSNPIPAAAAPSTYFILNNIAVNINDQSGVTADLTFFSSANSGGLDIFSVSGVNPILSLDGPQLYTGVETAPMFAPVPSHSAILRRRNLTPSLSPRLLLPLFLNLRIFCCSQRAHSQSVMQYGVASQGSQRAIDRIHQ